LTSKKATYRIWEIIRKDIMDNTIKLLQKQHDVLVDVIVWMDQNKKSNTEIRSKVDTILNFEKKLKEDSEMELTRISLK
jgi:hypothetical protein